MTAEAVIELFRALGGLRGRTATPGHGYYNRARELGFQPCPHSVDPATGLARDFIARTRRGAILYVGMNRRGRISCGPKGTHYSERALVGCP